MSTYRKKSTTSTDGSSSSSSSGSSTSGSSSSCSDSGSSSESESSSSTAEVEKNGTSQAVKTVESKDPKSQTTRRKSSEFKAAAKAADVTEKSSTAVKSRPTNSGTAALRVTARSSAMSSEDDTPPTKKPVRPTNLTAAQRRKNSGSGGGAAATHALKPPTVGLSGGKAPPTSVKMQQSQLLSAAKANSAHKAAAVKQQTVEHTDSVTPLKDMSVFSPAGTDDESDKELHKATERSRNIKATTTTIASAAAVSAAKQKQSRSKPPPKRSTVNKTATTRQTMVTKPVSESESESASASPDESSSSESEASDSSNSFASHPQKATKGKRAPTAAIAKMPLRSDSDDINAATAASSAQEVTPRKLTRSLSTRRSKQKLKQDLTDSDSDALADLDAEKRSLSKSPAKKPAAVLGGGGTSKCKVKKEGMQSGQRAMSPPQQHIEKKCPIEGCDSSGHLSGNLDRHFLPEACPIYHNMSASECKERANERKLRDEQRLKSNTANAISPESSIGSSHKAITPEQKEFLAKIRESRARFRPIAAAISSDKVKLEKDCTDEDREPSLTGLVPDYDLQLFREAQALASEKVEDELKDLPVGKGIKYITMGKYKMKVWYQSPYPDDAARLPKMYICEFCLRYQKSETGIKRHAQKCVWRHPPGDEIYRKGKLQVWQVDGKRHKQYCQHLCLLAKFFLDHKTLYYDVEPFLFYIMTLADVDGCHTVGYFSKEKNSFYNVSCILTLPPYQRKGYGRLLIDFSYLLTRVERKIGSPEKPLSDLGLISYRSYWKDVLLEYLCSRSGNTLSIKDVSQEMAIYSYDIVSTLQALGMMKYWKGKHIVLKKQDVLDEYEERIKRRGNFPKIDDTCLRWKPFVPTQTNNSP